MLERLQTESESPHLWTRPIQVAPDPILSDATRGSRGISFERATEHHLDEINVIGHVEDPNYGSLTGISAGHFIRENDLHHSMDVRGNASNLVEDNFVT